MSKEIKFEMQTKSEQLDIWKLRAEKAESENKALTEKLAANNETIAMLNGVRESLTRELAELQKKLAAEQALRKSIVDSIARNIEEFNRDEVMAEDVIKNAHCAISQTSGSGALDKMISEAEIKVLEEAKSMSVFKTVLIVMIEQRKEKVK